MKTLDLVMRFVGFWIVASFLVPGVFAAIGLVRKLISWVF
jgi:hypothetical protein